MRQTRDEVEREVLKVGEEWAAAERRGDTTDLERMLANDFVGIGPRGFMLSKEQWLGRYRSGDFKNESFTWDEAKVRVYGEAAVVTGREDTTATYQGHPTGGEFRTTLVFVMQERRWRLASIHLSPILPAP